MSLFPVQSGVCQFSAVAPNPEDPYRNGIRLYATDNATRCCFGGAVNTGTYGLRFNAAGAVLVMDTTAGLPAGTVYSNGLPIAPNGALCVADDATVSYNQGLPYTANGSIRGTALGNPELIQNGDFSAGSANWTVSGADATHIATFDGSTLRYQSDTTSPQLNISQPVGLTIGQNYTVTIVVSAYVSGTLKTDTLVGGPSVGAVGTFVFTAAAQTTDFNLTRGTINVDITIDSVSVKIAP